MNRRLLASHARPMLLLVLLSIAAAPVALAQDATTQERLDRLERDLSMLQRQVYRGGDSAMPAAGTGSEAAVDTQVRMDRLEQQMRDLTGRVENETNEVEQLRQRLEQINSDIDVRLSQGQGGAPGQEPSAASPSRRAPAGPAMAADEGQPEPDADAVAPYRRPRPADAISSPPGRAASAGTLTPPGTAFGSGSEGSYPGPTQLSPQTASAASGGSLRPPNREALPPRSTSAQYNAAFGLLRRADYPAAENALRGFIQQHPKDPLAGNAQYWLGESFYARGQYTEAAAAFADGYKRYPHSSKAADGLLQLGMSLARANQKHNACIALMQLDHDFPHPGSAVKSRAAQEKKRLGC